jgi:hypothetical protein
MPQFKEGEAERERRKQAELAPYLERALQRKRFARQPPDDQIPRIVALGRQIVQQLPESPTGLERQGALSVPLRDPADG